MGKVRQPGPRRSKANGRSDSTSPNIELGKARESPPVRQPNQTSRTREYLTPDEVERMITAAHQANGRLAERDALLNMMAYRHGLRASELAGLRWDQVDLRAGALHVARRKNGSPSTHPLRGPELRALRSWRRQQDEAAPYVFTSLRGGPMTVRTIHYVVAQIGKAAGIKFPVHPHMLRHATGFYLANTGHDTRNIQLYLGHRNIQHTTRYTELSQARFKDFWKD
jgi:type 1 fimbriae regulatory protein FimB/type 1 fimbriae regulatory protein FimE